MKICLKKKLTLFLVVALLVPVFWNQNVTVASAATPALTQTKVEISGIGETYDLNIKNKVKGSTYKWTTSNKTVATVTKSGLITSVKKGTATIRCNVTYPSKKTKTLSCKVTVIIPATEISISNAPLVNGAYQLALNSSVDFETVLAPENSTDANYWYIDSGDTDCIRIDDASKGTITGIKAGKVVLRVKAVKTSTKEAAALSDIDAAVIIEVVAPTAGVKSADIVSSNQISVVFDSPVQQSTVINTNNTLSSNITVSMCKNTKNVLADDPGTLTASLSTDMKTLTITSANAFDGIYGINFTNSIMSTSGIALAEYYKQMTYTDTIAPYISAVTMDDTGLIATINFSEALDFSTFKVSGATLVTTGVTADATTISKLNNANNYVISTDKKSVTINLSNIVVSDYGKIFTVVISGIKDLSGNSPSSAYLMATLRTDTSPRPQAKYLYMTRTSYNTITATFDRAIKTGGWIQISGGTTINGVVDVANNKKVNYTISDAEAQYTGVKQVSICNWNSYNVISTDTSASSMYTYSLDFTTEKVNPYCTYAFDASTGILTLTYNESVNITTVGGTFSSIFTSTSDDIRPGTNITYTNVSHTDGNNIIKLKLSNMSLIGNYTFTLEAGFVKDYFKNFSLSYTITIGNSSGTSAELPAPYMITQSTTDLNEIDLYFANKLDTVSAQTASNYTITGVTILKAELVSNSSDGAIVKLTVADNSIEVTVGRPITVTGVKGYNNSYTAITSYQTTIELKENKKPYYISTTFDTTTKNGIKLLFSEQVTGSLVVKVTQTIYGITTDCTNVVTINSNYAYISLVPVPTNGAYLKVEIISNGIKDLSGNAVVPMSTILGTTASY
ncbi:MAG: hypothetical protein PHF63_01105 [Herbinix sp.]|nr:hypothetical protein [Herbinix sp.]